MSRTSRIALLGALAMLVVLAGTTFATRSPVAEPATPHHGDEHEGLEDAAVLRVAERLDVDEARVRELAADHGFGGAVRLLAWEKAGASIADMETRRAEGQGWGEIAKDLGMHPGLGSVMGNGGGHGRENAPGQQQGRGADD